MKYEAINFARKLAKFSDHWSPRVIAEMNDYQIKLAKVAGENNLSTQLTDFTNDTFSQYYRLSKEELEALAKGDVKKIEGWVSRLDKRHANWLWHLLNQKTADHFLE